MPSLWDDATAPFTGQQQQPQDDSSLWGWLSSALASGQPFKSGNPALDQMMMARDQPDPQPRAEPPPLGQSLMDLASTVAPYLVGGAPTGSLSSGMRLPGKIAQATEEMSAPPAPGLQGFHGTNRQFEDFDQAYSGQKNAIFFTPSAEEAAIFGKNVMERHLDVSNPKTFDWGGGFYNEGRMNDAIQAAKDAGHDALIVGNIRNAAGREPSTTYAVWDAGKIRKSASALPAANPQGFP
jgi:hypothetical protein